MLALSIGTAAAGLWSGGIAGAAVRSPARHEHPAHIAGHGKSKKKKRHGARRGGLPVIEHAGDLSEEPVIRADRGTPPTRLLVKNLVTGTGATVSSASTVTVKYVGADYVNGKVFTDQTWSSGRATTFPLSGVVPGFAEGLVGMRVGGRREIVIPPKLGYKNRADGPIKPHETLVFVVDLESVSS